MTEFVIFLIDLALVIGASIIALVARTTAAARLAVGLYGLVTGVGLILVPLVGWEVARSDNAFLGLYLIALLAFVFGAVLTLRGALGLRLELRFSKVLGPAAVALLAGAIALALLVVRGARAWATGSGQFGLDVIAIDVALGVGAYFAGRAFGRQGGQPTQAG